MNHDFYATGLVSHVSSDKSFFYFFNFFLLWNVRIGKKKKKLKLIRQIVKIPFNLITALEFLCTMLCVVFHYFCLRCAATQIICLKTFTYCCEIAYLDFDQQVIFY